MNRNGTITLEFFGDLPMATFAEFATHRATRLSLGCEAVSQSPTRAVFRLTGPEAMIDAFEMALSLGPADCLVHDVRRHTNAPRPAPFVHSDIR